MTLILYFEKKDLTQNLSNLFYLPYSQNNCDP